MFARNDEIGFKILITFVWKFSPIKIEMSRTTNDMCDYFLIVLEDIIFWLARLVVWWYIVEE